MKVFVVVALCLCSASANLLNSLGSRSPFGNSLGNPLSNALGNPFGNSLGNALNNPQAAQSLAQLRNSLGALNGLIPSQPRIVRIINVNGPGPFGPGQAPFGNGQGPYGNGPAPYGNGPAPYGNGPAPYGNGPAPYGAGPGPYGNGPAPYGAGPGPYGNGPQPFGNVQQQQPDQIIKIVHINGQNAGPAPYAAPYGYGPSSAPASVKIIKIVDHGYGDHTPVSVHTGVPVAQAAPGVPVHVEPVVKVVSQQVPVVAAAPAWQSGWQPAPSGHPGY